MKTIPRGEVIFKRVPVAGSTAYDLIGTYYFNEKGRNMEVICATRIFHPEIDDETLEDDLYMAMQRKYETYT